MAPSSSSSSYSGDVDETNMNTSGISNTNTAPAPSNNNGEDVMIDRDLHPSGIVPTLQNIVSTVNLGCRLDLKQIALHARNAEYNPKVNNSISNLNIKSLLEIKHLITKLCCFFIM